MASSVGRNACKLTRLATVLTASSEAPTAPDPIPVRELTHDVDVVTDIPIGLADQVTRLAGEYNLRPDWMNNRARAFRPADANTDEVVFRRFERSRRTICF